MNSLRNRFALPSYIWRHPANRRRRLQAIGRSVAFQFVARLLRRPVIVFLTDRARLYASPGSSASTKVVYANPPDWKEMRFWAEVLYPGDLFIDVGANVGVYSLWAASRSAEVIAVEPQPDVVVELIKNVELNPELTISVVRCALSSSPGRARLIPKGTRTYLATDDDSLVGARLVDIETLDNLVGQRIVAGVKVDVEGAERLVLAGASRALAEKRIALLQLEWNALSESNFNETRKVLTDLLHAHDYELFRLTDDLEAVVLASPPIGTEDVFARPRIAV